MKKTFEQCDLICDKHQKGAGQESLIYFSSRPKEGKLNSFSTASSHDIQDIEEQHLKRMLKKTFEQWDLIELV